MDIDRAFIKHIHGFDLRVLRGSWRCWGRGVMWAALSPMVRANEHPTSFTSETCSTVTSNAIAVCRSSYQVDTSGVGDG